MTLMVALDFHKQSDILNCIKDWDPDWCVLKIGLEAFTALGPDMVRALTRQGFRIFLDLKYHDIPTTVAKACAAAQQLGVFMINIHAMGGLEMMQAARQALPKPSPYLIAVTILTSQQAHSEEVVQYAQLAQQAGLDGVVCSAQEVPAVKAKCGASFITVTPGIRLASTQTHDQKRVVTPNEAIQLGSDYLVLGRAVTQAPDPTQALQAIYEDLQNASIRT